MLMTSRYIYKLWINQITEQIILTHAHIYIYKNVQSIMYNKQGIYDIYMFSSKL